jgi:hypothetical protein
VRITSPRRQNATSEHLVNQALAAIQTLKDALAETAAALDADEKTLASRLDHLVETARPTAPTPDGSRL